MEQHLIMTEQPLQTYLYLVRRNLLTTAKHLYLYHQFLLMAVADTYRLIPINGAFFETDTMITSLIQFLSEYMIIGFRICLPVFAVIMVLNAVLGVLAKIAPQMNMFSVGIQLKILIGLMTLFFTTAMLPGAADFIFRQIRLMVTRMVEGMM